MFRRLMLSAVLAAGTVTGLAVTPNAAEAQPPAAGRYDRHDHRHDQARFEVVYRHGRHWDSYATFRDRDDAERVARRLRYRGYDVRIERERGW
jgi:hypothetical protein